MVQSIMKDGALNCLKCIILVAMEMFADTDEPGISLFRSISSSSSSLCLLCSHYAG